MFHAPAGGGVRRYLEAKQRWLRGRHRHTLLVPGATATREGAVQRVPALRLPGAGGYRFPLRAGAWHRAMRALAPDIIEAADPYRLGWAARSAAQQLGVPAVAFYHSDLARMVAVRLGPVGGRAAGLYVRALYDGYDRVLAPSQAMMTRLMDLGVSRVGYQPLGVDVRRFHPRLRDHGLRSALGIAPHVRLLMFVGRHAPEKNVPRLIEMAARLGSAYHLLLIGPGMPAVAARNVTVWSRYVRARLPALLASADALVHAGDQETFGLVVLEAMASAVPVVGCPAGAVPELIVPGTGVVAQRCTAAAMADAVDALFAADAPAAGRLARAVVRRRWAWGQVLPGLLDHYHACLRPVSHGAFGPVDAGA